MANMRYMFQVDSQSGRRGAVPARRRPGGLERHPAHEPADQSRTCRSRTWITDFRTRGGMAAVADEVRARGLDRSQASAWSAFPRPSRPRRRCCIRMSSICRSFCRRWSSSTRADILQEMRVVKSEEEIEILRGAGKIARKVIDAMVESARPGVPEAQVYAEMIKTQIANGGEPNVFNLLRLGSGRASEDRAVAPAARLRAAHFADHAAARRGRPHRHRVAHEVRRLPLPHGIHGVPRAQGAARAPQALGRVGRVPAREQGGARRRHAPSARRSRSSAGRRRRRASTGSSSASTRWGLHRRSFRRLSTPRATAATR